MASPCPRIDLEFGKRELQDGLVAIAVRNPGVPTFSIGVSLHVGQLDEGDGEHGLATLVGAALEEGTAERSALALAEAVEDIGASLSTDEDGARIHCPAGEAGRAAELVREVALDPGFRDVDIERVRREILTEIEADEAEPSTIAGQRFRSEIYGAHPFARPSYGSRASIEALGASDAARFHDRWFRPSRGYVAVSGPAEIEASLDLLAQRFEDFRGESPAVTPLSVPEHPTETRRVHLPLDREQVHVFLGHPGVRRTDPDFIALLVMDQILGAGAGFTARIPKKLRDEQGLCYSVSAAITSSAGEEPGTFRAYIGTSPEHREAAIDGFLVEIRAIREQAPTAEELSVAHDYLAGSFVLGLERNANLLGFAIRMQRYGLGFDYLREFAPMVRAVTAEDVRRVAEQHLDPDRVVIVSAGACE